MKFFKKSMDKLTVGQQIGMTIFLSVLAVAVREAAENYAKRLKTK